MPDDSSGIYSVPAGTIVSTGDTILPSQHNPWANDSASAISARFSKDGRAPATGNWNINSFRLTNVGAPVAGGDAVNKTYADAAFATFATTASVALKLDILQPSVDVASAATTDIGAAASQNVRVTGTTTITSFGTVAAGTFRRVRFAGALTLTHNGTSLILPDGGNVTTAAGDVLEFISEGSGNWRCTSKLIRPSKFLHVRDQKTAGTAGGSSSSGVNVRVLNTVVGTNGITGSSLASNQVTLPAGTYHIRARASAFRAANHQLSLRTSGGTYLIDGTIGYSAGGDFAESTSHLEGRITLASSTALELAHDIPAGFPTNGLGLANASGRPAVFAEMFIEKID